MSWWVVCVDGWVVVVGGRDRLQIRAIVWKSGGIHVGLLLWDYCGITVVSLRGGIIVGTIAGRSLLDHCGIIIVGPLWDHCGGIAGIIVASSRWGRCDGIIVGSLWDCCCGLTLGSHWYHRSSDITSGSRLDRNGITLVSRRCKFLNRTNC